MLRNKRILLIFIFAFALFLIPSICNADTITATETTKTSTGVDINWSYELDESGNIVNLICTNKSSVKGTVAIPSKLDNHTVVELGSTRYTWKEGTFEGCNGLTGVTIPNTITKIGANCFEGCTGLTNVTIPNSVTEICDEDVFKECTGLTSINIPDSVTRIGDYAFNGCTGIKTVTLGKNVTIIGSGAFNGCTGFKEITIPNSVTKIESNAFAGCTGLRSLSIPDNVTTIGTGAFSGCTGITSLKLSESLTKIDQNVFEKCTGLTSVIIPSSVTTIAGGYNWQGAFEECKNLTKVLIPDDVATIEDYAFCKCEKLTIYGNDNQASKTYAENNNINFDYIANWDKVAAGEDITPPELKTLKIEYSSIFKYDAGTQYYLASAGTNIQIKATFEEEVYGDKAPTLTIKCGNGGNITITNGVIQGKYIIYTYTIKDADKGIISSVSMTGGDVKDKEGNLVEKYTCPELTTLSNSFVFANGTGSVTNNQGNNNNNGSSTVTLSSIAITKTPTRNTYLEGEKFDKSGMVITAKYSDGSTKTITNYTVTPSVALKTTDTKVVISYTENGVTKTVEQKITVTAKVTNNGNSNGTGSGTSNKNNTTTTSKDTTTKNDSKLPQTGVTLVSVAIISLGAVAVISKVKYGSYKDI